MPKSTTRRRAVRIGLLVGLPTILIVGVAAAGWVTAGRPWSPLTGGSDWSGSQAHGSQVASAPSVRISGTGHRPLTPGGRTRINLGFANPGPNPIKLRHVRVTIKSITAPQADAEHPCTTADFRVRPMRARPLVLPGGGSTNLVRLRVPAWQWPHLKMRNRPVNQDGCKDATLTLSYRGYQAAR